ncbi:MAG: hypothetical protein GX434_14445 [Peptococcaceae bacterium]|nr:hypothetical protein [Peptococcaceae bacterium]
MSLKLKYFIASVLLSCSILAAVIIVTYNDAKSYLLSGLGREAVSLGRTVASSNY